MFTALSSSQFSFEGTVEDGGEQGSHLGGGFGLQAVQRIHFCHCFQSLSVASTMTSAAWRSHFGFRCAKSRRTAATARRVPKWTFASSRPMARSNFSSSWPRGNSDNSIRLQEGDNRRNTHPSFTTRNGSGVRTAFDRIRE